MEVLFERADQALYHSKNAGRNQLFVCKDPQEIPEASAGAATGDEDTSEPSQTPDQPVTC